MQHLSLCLLEKTWGNHLPHAESPSDTCKPTVPSCFRSGPGAWRQRQFWSLWGTWGSPRASNHSQCPTSVTYTSQQEFFICYRKNVVIQPKSPPTVWSLKGCLGCQQDWLHQHRLHPLHLCWKQIVLVKEARHTMSTSTAISGPALQATQITTVPREAAFPIPPTEILHHYPICSQFSYWKNPSIDPSGKASAQS